MKKHHYSLNIKWTGNKGKGTAGYKSYGREHTISAEGKKEVILCSSDPSFLGDPTLYNPEELFLSSIATCHMLWYLHFCSDHKIIVTHYEDHATGIMQEDKDGSGKFTEVNLRPTVTIENMDMQAKAIELHGLAHKYCFIANSCNFEIKCLPMVKSGGGLYTKPQ